MKIFHTSTPHQELACFLQGAQPRAFTFDFAQYYLPDTPVLRLLGVLTRNSEGAPYALVTDRVSDGVDYLKREGESVGRFQRLPQLLAAPWVPMMGAWKLAAVNVPKPWGQEIWYTGIEARGQSHITDGVFTVPLPWVLALGSDLLLMHGCCEPNLLKILDPLPEEVFGDLYFELHEEKREVYVVTHVSVDAWPDGRGAIRYGFDPDVRASYGDDAAFRRAYLEAVRAYEVVRREIDALIDQRRLDEGVPLDHPVDAQTLKRWLSTLPAELHARERDTREAMNAFTHMVPLQAGDVVKVATLTPHALQHGVRTVEFQTPVYERKILSFAQKVLTQSHWDTPEAVALMSLEPGRVEALPLVKETSDYRLEQVVCFEDFEVYRLTLLPGATYQDEANGVYRVLFAVTDGIASDSLALAPEDAVLFPATAAKITLHNSTQSAAVCLISKPIASSNVGCP